MFVLIPTHHVHLFLSLLQIRGIALDQINKIRITGAQGDSMMHFLVQHSQGLDDQEVVDELISLVMAGHESEYDSIYRVCVTALSLFTVIYLISGNVTFNYSLIHLTVFLHVL